MEVLLIIVLAGYGVCTALAVYALSVRRAVLAPAASIALAAGLGAQTVWLFHRGVTAGRCPLIGAQEMSAFLSWSLVVAYLVAQRWYTTAALKAFVFPIVFLLSAVAAIVPDAPPALQEMNQPLPRLLLGVHAGLIMLAYASFFISFGAGVMYIVQERELKLKRFGAVFQRLPSLDTCDAISFRTVAVGFILLTLGVGAGIIWSHMRDGVYWHGDPTELFAVVTWFIYLIIIQSRLTAGWGGRNAAFATIIGFALVICSLAGLRYLDTLHVLG
ncbi:MAG TPA: cytochrome c biogenesis protein CcsA [Blastocatellia bacterium]|nr:cytochrome c biogenesis protein CcsA [Blastocatellia bacterium]